jgi:DNA (cytosine-5)-methyltransferase 1
VNGLIVDNFAGGGGASTGIARALGRPVDIAINHDAEAVAMHLANHPETKHFCQSIMAIDPRDACTVDGHVAKVALAWFSPDCKHHSKAKGGKPREKNIRDLAWVVVHWPERLGENAPDIIMLENVEEFRQWGPLDPDTGMPIKERQGEEFELWVRRLKRCSYKVEYRELRACDYGAPTSRKRLYLIARRDKLPIVWPAPTHGPATSPDVLSGKLKPYRTAAECIDWSIECPSIFDRVRPLKDTTMSRIAHGTMRYVVNAARPFIVPITHSGSIRVHSADEPLRTVTTAKRGEMAVVVPHVTKFRGGAVGSHAGEPMPTVTANGNPARPAGAQPLALASATLVQTGYGERKGQAPRALDIEAPLGTVVGGGCKHAAVAAFLSAAYTSNTNGGRGKPDLPLKTVMAGGKHHAVVCAHIEQANTGMVGHHPEKPLSTIVGKGCTQRIVETTMIEEGDLPPELMCKATRVAAFLIKYYGAAQHGQALDEPMHSVTSLARFAVVTVTIDAVTYVIVDIGMRMLTPRELARAQGFPDTYVLDPIGPNGKPLSKSAQIRMIGNSVCPDVAEAIIRPNVPAIEVQPEAEAA